jgi:hypothetical protein
VFARGGRGRASLNTIQPTQLHQQKQYTTKQLTTYTYQQFKIKQTENIQTTTIHPTNNNNTPNPIYCTPKHFFSARPVLPPPLPTPSPSPPCEISDNIYNCVIRIYAGERIGLGRVGWSQPCSWPASNIDIKHGMRSCRESSRYPSSPGLYFSEGPDRAYTPYSPYTSVSSYLQRPNALTNIA